MIELTEKQYNVYKFVESYIDENGFSPSQQDIANELGIWQNAARNHVNALIKKGVLKNGGKSRSLSLVKDVEVV